MMLMVIMMMMMDTYLFFFFFFTILISLCNISSPNRDLTWTTAVKLSSPNHWTTREFLNENVSFIQHLPCVMAMPWTEEPSGLQSIGLRRVGHD